MSWSLADIRNKVRRITGRRSVQQLSNADLDTYINDFIVYEMPAEIKTDKLRVFYDFTTVRYTRDYEFGDYTNVQPNIYIDGLEVDYYQDFNFYKSAVPDSFKRETVGTGDGIAVAYSGTLENPPMIAGLVLFTNNTETFTDPSENGILVGSAGGSGTIDYISGAWTLTFNAAPLLSQSITADYLPFTAGRPTAAFVFNERIQFHPVPDSAYHVRVVAFKIPALLSSSTSTPELQEWGPMIAVGAARQIFLDNAEMERYAEIEPVYREKIKLSMRRVMETMNYERAAPRF